MTHGHSTSRLIEYISKPLSLTLPHVMFSCHFYLLHSSLELCDYRINCTFVYPFINEVK